MKTMNSYVYNVIITKKMCYIILWLYVKLANDLTRIFFKNLESPHEKSDRNCWLCKGKLLEKLYDKFAQS